MREISVNELMKMNEHDDDVNQVKDYESLISALMEQSDDIIHRSLMCAKSSKLENNYQ
jgi:hypothetical protein